MEGGRRGVELQPGNWSSSGNSCGISKKNNFIQRSRNAVKLLFKSNMKVGINRRVLADDFVTTAVPY